MPMMKALKRAFLLNVGEIVVPFELGDAGDPLFSERQVGKDAERSNNLGANAGARWDFELPACFWWRGRNNLHRPQSCACGRWHDSREIFRICEEEKHLFDRDWDPLFRF